MLIQSAVFPDLKEVVVAEQAETESSEQAEEITEESANITEKVSAPRNKGGRPRKN